MMVLLVRLESRILAKVDWFGEIDLGRAGRRVYKDFVLGQWGGVGRRLFYQHQLTSQRKEV